MLVKYNQQKDCLIRSESIFLEQVSPHVTHVKRENLRTSLRGSKGLLANVMAKQAVKFRFMRVKTLATTQEWSGKTECTLAHERVLPRLRR
jgi:hypothetical protein